jgi:oxaloacetate decarboxylase alpha subunit
MNVDRIEALAKLLHGSKAQELVIETDGWRVGMRKAPAPSRPASPSPFALERVADANLPPLEPAHPWITAPLVGIFRQADPRVTRGDVVSAGQPVGAIESMKIVNPLISELDGEVIEVLVEDGQPVEYGQPLLQIRRLATEEPESEGP